MRIFIWLIFSYIFIFANANVKNTKWELNKSNKYSQKDIIYDIDLKKYPKFNTEAKLKNGKIVKFASFKSMMQAFYNQDFLIKHKLLEDKIEKLYVKDYLSGEKLEANKALYIFGSRLVGPHGDDLIPVKDQNSAEIFKLKYGGTKVLPFKKISKALIKYLDM
jgi:hypothetical protein